MAESEGARQEREIDELNKQFDEPAYEGDNRRMPSMEDVLDADAEATTVLFDMLNKGSWGKVMTAAFDDGAAYGNDTEIIEMSRAIAKGGPEVREWFARLADAMAAKVRAEKAMKDRGDAGGWNEIHHRGSVAAKVASELAGKKAARPPLYDPREHSVQCEDCSATLSAGTDPIDAGWSVGRKDGEFLCDECVANGGEARLSSKVQATIPDDGYADGGTPYTDDEMDIIDRDDSTILEGKPTPPLARDQASETGVDVQDCFGDWHKPWTQDGGFGLFGQGKSTPR